jgi:type 2 lantibiotic biosynthesis protein LanM
VNAEVFQNPDWYRAATLRERALSLPGICGSPIETALASRRIKRWREQPPFPSGSYFEQRLAADGLGDNHLLYCLGEPAEALQNRLGESPDWLGQLSAQLSGPRSSRAFPAREQPTNAAGFLVAIEPMIQHGLERVEQGARALADSHPNAPFEPRTATEALFANLPQQLLSMIARTMVLELHVARLDGLLSGTTPGERFQSFVDRLRQPEISVALLQEYPVLARQLALRINQWAEFSLEFLERLTVDWHAVQTSFGEEGPGMLVEATGGAGDHHRGGRSVMIARFSSGLRIVYKPRSLSVDVHFQELLEWLNERAGWSPFRTLRVLDRPDYGWVEFVAAGGCSSSAELTRFYERQGAYLAVLYALEATDFHFENLIAAGEHPVLPDLEALFHPRIDRADLRQAEALAGNAIAHSMARVGLLPQLGWGSGAADGVDLSGLGSVAGQLTPRPVPQWEGEGTDEMHQVRKRVEMLPGRNQPALDGAPVEVLEYAEAIVSGFDRMYRCLLSHRDELLAGEGPVARFAGDEVRVILRATQTYGSLLQESYHPDVLRDALDRDRLFDRLWTAVEQSPHLADVITAERTALENGDVPIFTACPASHHLRTDSGGVIPDFTKESGMELARRRIQQLSEQDCARQIWFIRASLAMLSRQPEHSRPRSGVRIANQNVADRGRLLEAACHIGERLEHLALRGAGDISWIGLTFIDQKNWSLCPAGIDLYDGLPGIALFLAHLGELSGEARFSGLARAALATVRRLATSMSPSGAIGAFDGVGGVIYMLAHLSSLWREPSMLDDACALVGQLPSLIGQDRRLDIIGGAAGCVGALAALYSCAPSEQTLAAAIQCGEHLVRNAMPQDRGVAWISPAATHPLTGFSHGAAGISWALLRLFELSGDERFLSTALRGIEYERSQFSSNLGNWRDLRAADRDDACMTAWCHGAPGIGLSRLLSLPWIDGAETRSEIDTAFQTTLESGFGGNHCLCHGDLGNVDVLLEAGLTTAAYRAAGVVLESIERDGWLCGNPVEIESPGLMTGLAGIGYELLRLAAPERVPSVLALELCGAGPRPAATSQAASAAV